MKTIIYGNGAMARVLYSYARTRMEIAGFTVDECCIAKGTRVFENLPLTPFEAVETVFDPKSHGMLVAVGFNEMNELRRQRSLQAREKGYTLASYVHESVQRHDDVVIEDNCIILDFVSIHPGSTIGEGTFISSNVNIGHDCHIGAYNYITSGSSVAGGCRTGSGCFLGVNATLTHGVTLGEKTFVAAHTLMNHDTKPEEVYLSEPGQLFRLKSPAFLNFRKVLP